MLNRDLAGKKYTESTYTVTAEAIERYARATNDDNDRYFHDVVVASPVFVVVPAFASFMEAATDPELGADMLRLVHSAEEHIVHQPLRPGDALTVTPILESVDTGENGDSFTVAATEVNQHDELVAVVRGTMFIRGTGGRRAAAGPATSTPGATVYEETTKVDDDQTYRYADASGDHNPIHVDPDTARAAGLPGIILHGMCTMAMATKAAVNGPAAGDPTRITRVAVRFSRPVLPGWELTTRLWRDPDLDASSRFGFETVNSAGKAVIRDGGVDIAAG
jgi:acyl dehydratase